MQTHKTPMPEQPPQERILNFDEVTLGYTEELAQQEAARCLNCKTKPCVAACPVNVHIPEFIQAVVDRDYELAYRIITETNSMPAICGRVCPQETQCEAKCVLGIKHEPVAIGRLERFVADWHMANVQEKIIVPPSNGKKVATIGAGPSGLSCAYDLALKGYDVTIYEALHEAGGVLAYGIPEFRLPTGVINYEIGRLLELGVKIECNVVIGRALDMDDLFARGFDAVYIASGAGLPNFMNIEGENLKGVYSANEYLTRVNLMKSYQKDAATPIRQSRAVAVVGGGNVAMDAVRCAKRIGAEVVYLIYRRSEEEMPARVEEVHHAKEEGVLFRTLTNPVRILGDETGQVAAIECVEMALGEADASGRRSTHPKEGTEFLIPVDTVIMAIGTSPNPLVTRTIKDLETNRHGCIVTDAGMQTSIRNIYAGGDAVKGAATVIYAMGTGKIAADSIHRSLSEQSEA